MSMIPQLMSGRRLEHDALSTGQFVSLGFNYVQMFSDFLEDNESEFSLEEAGTTDATIALGTADPDGNVLLSHNGTNEAQSVAITGGGTAFLNPHKEPIFETRLKITLSTDATFDAASNYLVFVGLVTKGTAVSTSATLISASADHVGFQLGSDTGTLNIYCESDDGTNDNDLKDSGIDFVSGTYVTLKIDMTDLSNVRFFIDGAEANNGNTFDMSNIAATDYLEPYILFSRTSNGAATERAHVMSVDYLRLTWKRS